MNRSIYFLIVFLGVCLLTVGEINGQNVDSAKGQDPKGIVKNAIGSDAAEKQEASDADNSLQTENKKADATKAKPASQDKPKASRWFDLQTATLALRYAYNETSSGVTTFNRVQHSEIFRAAF